MADADRHHRPLATTLLTSSRTWSESDELAPRVSKFELREEPLRQRLGILSKLWAIHNKRNSNPGR